MIALKQFSAGSGWHIRDASLESLRAILGAKLSVGGEGSTRNLHRHNKGEKEIFFVLAGTATAIVDGEAVPLGLGLEENDFLLIEDEEHGIFDKSADFRCAIFFLKPA